MDIFQIFQFVQVNWSIIIIINGFTVFTKRVFPLIKPYCAYVVMLGSAIYAILYGLLTELSLYQAFESGFLHAAVASYVYSLIKKPLQSRTGRKIKDSVKNMTSKAFTW